MRSRSVSTSDETLQAPFPGEAANLGVREQLAQQPTTQLSFPGISAESPRQISWPGVQASSEADPAQEQQDWSVEKQTTGQAEEQKKHPPMQDTLESAQDSSLEDQPTRPITAAERQYQDQATMSEQTSPIDELDTVHTAVPPSTADASVDELDTVHTTVPASAPDASVMHTPPPHTPPLSPQSLQHFGQALSGPSVQGWQKKFSQLGPMVSKRRTFLIVIALLLVLLFGTVGAWMTMAQPFSVAPVTQPWQAFQDQGLGVSLAYPNGWTVQVDHGKSAVHFFDSSLTAQFELEVVPSATANLTQYLQQQGENLGMTSVKSGSPQKFAGTSWQQVQGNMLRNGANYVGSILAAVYRDHTYKITQSAHQSIYTDEEKDVFSVIRTSLKFV
ncbi:hypothetical protein [Ktedonosporobacter rubrisoli]|uniref:hypothetical protein n=1 Tax=Ktedonosporobacter rubrisoli TaxID=2509675 RepID=UPI001F5D0AD3|nr:hypothetical protein [Ktedonosporobacter rubrisoli]